jgi:hypothetical protein
VIGGDPRVGHVVRYGYLWKADYDRGREESGKDRPCALIVSISGPEDDARIFVRVVPITHTRPADPTTAIEVPPVTRRRLGLDEQSSWIVLSESNTFAWPGPDLRPVPGKNPPSIYYGPLPPKLFKAIIDRLLELARQRRVRTVLREP